MPLTPEMPRSGLDPSWRRTLDYAFDARFQYGRDLLFTYGPLGFVQTDLYSPGSYPWIMAIRSVVIILLGIFYYKILRRLPLVYGLAVAFIILCAQRFAAEALYGSVPVVAALTMSKDEIRPAESVGLAILCGAVSLMKFSYFIVIPSVLLIMALYRFLRWREFPLTPMLALVAMVAWYLIAGQHWDSIWEYLRGSINVAAGYSEAMQFEGPLKEAIFFALLAAALPIAIGVNRFRRGMPPTFEVISAALIVFILFKEGFVRHDGGHVSTALAWLVAAIALYAAEMSRRRLEIGAVTLLLVAAGLMFLRYSPVPDLTICAVSNTRSLRELMRSGLRPLNVRYEAALAAIRQGAPLPVTKGGVDIYPYDQGVLLATNSIYHPRPVFQSYSAYTSHLIDRNVDSLKLATAPQTIFFDVETIDARFPAQDDGASWPELLTRYDVTSYASNFLRLDRRDSPRTYNLVPLLRTSIRFGAELSVKNGDSLIWAHIHLKKTFIGRLLTMLLSAPIVSLEVTLRDGTVQVFRIVPGEAAEGFLLSPLVQNGTDFLILDKPAIRKYLSPLQVEKIRISPQQFAAAAYENDVGITLDTLVLNGEVADMGGDFGPNLRRYTNLLFLDAGEKNGRCYLTNAEDGPQMFAHAHSQIVIYPPPAHELTVSFGIRDGAWQQGHPEGVEFRISTVRAGSRPQPIWSRTLMPVERSADRGLQKATLSLQLQVGDGLMLETLSLPMKTNNWAWSYWEDSNFE